MSKTDVGKVLIERLDFNKTLSHVSEKAWGDYSESDYTLEQWHAACLIHQHEGAPTSKNQCKLPVKTPSGAVNRNGVHSAAAALAGARGGVSASNEQKQAAARALVRLYRQLDEDPPASLMEHSSVEDGKSFLKHHGVKGMKWGVRRSRKQLERAAKGGGKSVKDMSNDELRAVVNRLQLEQQYTRLATGDARSSRNRGAQFAQDLLVNVAKQQITNAANAQVARALNRRRS